MECQSVSCDNYKIHYDQMDFHLELWQKNYALRNYALRDSDWIAIINLDEENNFVTKYDSEQQNEIKKRKEELKKLKIKRR